MISPRWHKILADLWGNKLRSLLVILSISMGVFAVGFVSTCFPMILQDMDTAYQAVNAHGGVIYTDPFDESLLDTVRSVPGVADADGRSVIIGKVRLENGGTYPIVIYGIPPVDRMTIDRISVQSGSEPQLGDFQIYIERSSQNAMPTGRGDVITLELMDGRIKRLTVAGIVHDINNASYLLTRQITAYVTPKTMEWLGGSGKFDQLYFTVRTNKTDEAYVTLISQEVADKIEKGGSDVYGNYVYRPGKHWASDYTLALTQIMTILGALSVFLSAFLVTNTVNSLLGQQIRQIGMMKAVGGKTAQLLVMYLGLVACFGVIALIYTIPMSAFMAYVISVGTSQYLNFDILGFRFIPASVALQVIVALLVPVMAALIPVLNGTRVTIREAISSYGISRGQFGMNLVDRIVEKIKFLSRPLLLSLRNTFRKKARLFLTLSTLTLAGSIFISVFNLRSSFHKAIDNAMGYFLSDVNISFGNAYRYQKLENVASKIPGVIAAEGWGFRNAEVLSDDGKSPVQVSINAPPSDSQLINPTISGGRWLIPGDENAVVIGNQLQKLRPDLDVGDSITLKIDGKESTWKIVGTYLFIGNLYPPVVYTNYDYFSRTVHDSDRVGNLRITTAYHDAYNQDRIARILESAYEAEGILVADIMTGAQFSAMQTLTTDILVYFLGVMSVLIAMVGGLGLMGTMGMNVIERTREIGVMRAIGANDRLILQLVIVEGMLIGAISWLIGFLLAIPVTKLMTTLVGISLMSTPMMPVYSITGIVAWLAGMLVIAALASVVPAYNASRLTVREVLVYE